MNDIFNLSDVNDVPEQIREDLGQDQFAQEIIKLFKMANRPLTINEVFIAHYRMFSAEKNQEGRYQDKPDIKPKTKRQITLKLYNMAKEQDSGIIQTGRGVYKLNGSQATQMDLPMFESATVCQSDL